MKCLIVSKFTHFYLKFIIFLEKIVEDVEDDDLPVMEVTTASNPDGFFPDLTDENACSVAVAVRVRPLVGRELTGG